MPIVKKNGDLFKPLKIKMTNLEYLMLYKLKQKAFAIENL